MQSSRKLRVMFPRIRGFTLIELMAVLAVIAILALMALPSMLDKMVREQVLEALPLAQVATQAVSKHWQLQGSMPASNEAAGLPVADKIISQLISSTTVDNGAVHMVFGPQANGHLRGKTLSMRPAVVADTPVVPVTWLCGHAKEPERMTVLGANKTDIATSYLPLRCR
jgi:type IV pilus assembly protein PilA